MRSSSKLALILMVAACGEKQEAVPPPPPPLAIAPMPVASSPPAAASSSDDMDAVTLLGAVYERSLNNGDALTAEASSSKKCWAKECASLSAQAKKKFKVKILGEPVLQGLHAVITMDVLCEGTRPCDRVFLLIMKDCAPNAQQTWLVDDVTEDKSKRRDWPTSAPGPCR